MKRILAAALTGTMLLGLGLSAGAAPSIQGGGAQQGNIPAEQVVEQDPVGSLEGAKVEQLAEGTVTWAEIIRDNYTEEALAVIDSLNEADAEVTVKEALEELVDISLIKLFDANGEVADADTQALLEELHFLSPVWELTFDGVEPTKENPVICTFTVNNLTEDMEVYMLFDCEEDGWELLKAEKAEDNQVKVAIHSTSAPAALVYRQADADTDAAAEGTSPVAAEAQTETEALTEAQ